jgi:hypothetical protein
MTLTLVVRPNHPLLEALDRAKFSHLPRYKLFVSKQVERRIEAVVAAMWKSQQRAVLLRLEHFRSQFTEASAGSGGLSDSLAEELDASVEDFAAEFSTSLSPAYVGGAEATAASLTRLPSGFDTPNPAASTYLRERGAQLVSGLNDTTRDRMRTVLADSREQGASYETTAQNLRDLFDGFDAPSSLGHIRDRAELVSVTEAGDAYEAGSRDTISALSDLGLKYEKQWLADAGACGLCSENAAEGWIPFDEEHGSGDSEPTGHPGCRCSEIYQNVSSGETWESRRIRYARDLVPLGGGVGKVRRSHVSGGPTSSLIPLVKELNWLIRR